MFHTAIHSLFWILFSSAQLDSAYSAQLWKFHLKLMSVHRYTYSAYCTSSTSYFSLLHSFCSKRNLRRACAFRFRLFLGDVLSFFLSIHFYIILDDGCREKPLEPLDSSQLRIRCEIEGASIRAPSLEFYSVYRYNSILTTFRRLVRQLVR